jgi:hypothetical protein
MERRPTAMNVYRWDQAARNFANFFRIATGEQFDDVPENLDLRQHDCERV